MDNNRIGSCSISVSGSRFWPLDVRPGDINPLDIAKALSNICRYGGHVPCFYSVAQHSVLVANQFPLGSEERKWGLLHDASEAFITDIPTPLKAHLLTVYVENGANCVSHIDTVEEQIHSSIAEFFGLSSRAPSETVMKADRRVLLTEAKSFFPDARWEQWANQCGLDPYNLQIHPLSPEEAQLAFLSVLREEFPAFA